MSKLKVYGGNLEGRNRAIIAATSMKAAVQVIKDAYFYRMSLHEFRNYWCETGNEEEIRVAKASPGTLFSKPYHDTKASYREWRRRPA